MRIGCSTATPSRAGRASSDPRSERESWSPEGEPTLTDSDPGSPLARSGTRGRRRRAADPLFTFINCAKGVPVIRRHPHRPYQRSRCVARIQAPRSPSGMACVSGSSPWHHSPLCGGTKTGGSSLPAERRANSRFQASTPMRSRRWSFSWPAGFKISSWSPSKLAVNTAGHSAPYLCSHRYGTNRDQPGNTDLALRRVNHDWCSNNREHQYWCGMPGCVHSQLRW